VGTALGTAGVIGAATGMGVATRECVVALDELATLGFSAAHAVDVAMRTANTPMPSPPLSTPSTT
jgi:hypothetical protein